MLISQMGAKLHFHNSITRKWTKVHLFNVGLTNLERGPKYLEISYKIGVHACLSNGEVYPLTKINS